MEETPFEWTHELTLRLLDLRYENDWLFKKIRQPWKDFYNILLDNGFPQTMSIVQLRKKWSYLYDLYKQAKKFKDKKWKYYKKFEKIYGNVKLLDKYGSWPDEWRLKLITCISEAKAAKLDFYNFWRTVERAMRCQELPENCCIQDMQGLWHHIRITFKRKHKVKHRKHTRHRVDRSEWPLYDAMVQYYTAHEPQYLARLDAANVAEQRQKKSSKNYFVKTNYDELGEDDEFQWTKDITESFIQIRLQHDFLFREKKWAWNDLLAIMQEEHGFPKTLTGREICRKWASTFSAFQKAQATNNKSWLYYELFELYLGDGNLSLNPLIGWQEEWISNLISTRIDFEHLFRLENPKDHIRGWREVEKRLRSIGLPLDHSLLDLPELWTHLLKTYKWKKKFADKGILTEHWPYFEALAQYEEMKQNEPPPPPPVKKQKIERETNYDQNIYNNDTLEDDYEDDMKLFDLKQKLELQVKPKFEYLEANQCRSCSGEDGCVNIFDHVDDHGLSLAEKLRVIGDVKVEPSDNLPSQICLNCVRELENAYKFRRKCQEVDKVYRNTTPHNIKIEIPSHYDHNLQHDNNEATGDQPHIFDDTDVNFDELSTPELVQPKPESRTIPEQEPKHKSVIRRAPPKIVRKKKRIKKEKYIYFKVCDICGKHTRNLKGHMDMHSAGKAYSCDVCDKKFKFKAGLLVHKAIHDPTPRKKCEVCGKTFHIMAQYRRHFVYHANERKFECETCGKRFNTLDILRVHARTHTDERPYSCPECGKTFRTAGCVSRHKRIVHRTTKIQ